MQNQNNINLHLSLNEINTILTALGDRPYVDVFELIRKIQQQASSQVNAAQEEQAAVSIVDEGIVENNRTSKAKAANKKGFKVDREN